MSVHKVKVISVESVPVGKDGQSKRIVMHYEGKGGEPWKVGNLATKLSAESRAALTAVKNGGELNVNIDKVDGYNCLVSAGAEAGEPAQKAAYGGGGGYAKKTFNGGGGFNKPSADETKDKDKNARIQAMNTLTSAVNSLGEGKSLSEYKQRAIDLYLIIEDITKQAVAGTLQADVTETQQLSQQDDIVEEIGF